MDFGLVGGLVGAFVGYLAYAWMLQYNFYAVILPGAFAGLGCGMLARGPSTGRGVACGVLGLAAGLLSEWKERPFQVDGSLGFFLGHLRDLTPVQLIMMGLGGVFAFWWGRGEFGPFAARGSPRARE